MKKYFVLGIYPTRLILAILLSVFIMTGKADADPNVLLGEAIKNATKLKGDLPTKQRLKAYEIIFNSLDKIVSEHSSSEQAIKILSDQKIGKFDPTLLRTAYIKELTEYYDTVCEVSPTYSCLGFVSLKTGNDQCEKSKNIEGIVEAHFNLKNAARVFIGQKDSNAYIPLALNSYRSCLKRSSLKATTFATDQFSSDLLELLLKSNQESIARATIENMKTPYFKFVGVLALQAYNKKTHDKAFSDRLKNYIIKKIPVDKSGAAAMSGWALLSDRIHRSDLMVDWKAIQPDRNMRFGGGGGPYTTATQPKCDHIFTRYLFDTVTNLHAAIWNVDKKRKGGNQNLWEVIRDHERHIAPFKTCYDKKSGLFNYAQMVNIHARLLTNHSNFLAEDFKRRAINEYWTERDQTKYFYDIIGGDKDLMDEHAEELLTKRYGSIPRNINGLFKGVPYFLFTKLVDHGSVCNASAILFKKLKGGPDYDASIKYMIESPMIDPNKKYECGDEDLELLLK